jgi:hypothetical protein
MLHLEGRGIGLGKRPRLQLNDRTLSNHRNKLDKALVGRQALELEVAKKP